MARILAIDDEKAITDLLSRSLTRDGHVVKTVNDPLHVLDMELSPFDIVICDVMMPVMDGFELIGRIRPLVDAPIVFLTAKVAEEDAVRGLALGADDYIRKPFGIAELRAKVNAHLRRDERPATHVLALGNVHFDLGSLELSVDGCPVALTPTEYAVCEYLARNHGAVLSRGQIRDNALGWSSDASDDAISVHVSNARAKLHQAGADPIETVRGAGYIWRT